MKAKFVFAVLGLVITSQAFSFSLNFEFKDGQTVCNEMSEKIASEISKWVSVPVDYKNPLGEKTLIYTYTLKKFDANKPSLIYFVGGPGSSSRGLEFSLPNTNVIFFEQRGISCSRPHTRELFLNPKFYSSENSAADGLKILDAYGIKKAAIYGHSYGTVPATIFASKYPHRTQSLLLEGVVFKADESLWISPRKIQKLEEYFHNLPIEKQQRIISFTARPDVAKTWYSLMGRLTMAVGNFPNGLTEFLDRTVFANPETAEQTDDELAAMLSMMVPKVDTTTPAEENGFGEITMGMIGCQEMNMANAELSHLLFLVDGHLVPDRNNIDRLSMCAPLGLAEYNNDFYSAEKYPINVPVTYFLGENDPATSMDQGVSHFKNAKSQMKQALVMKGGGHTPNIEKVMEAGYCNPNIENCDRYKQQFLEREIFEKASFGLKITNEDLQKFNSAGELKWIIKRP